MSSIIAGKEDKCPWELKTKELQESLGFYAADSDDAKSNLFINRLNLAYRSTIRNFLPRQDGAFLDRSMCYALN